MAFKMKNQSMAKMVKAAGDSRVAMKMKKESGSEEHTSELQSRLHLVCRLLLEKKKKHNNKKTKKKTDE